MDAERFRRLRAIYERAADLPSSEVPLFLEEACDGDEDLRSQTERMLAAGSAPHFLARPEDGPPPPPRLPDRIGRYRVLALLGEGGFGTVYRAEQREPVVREVALKVLHRQSADERAVLRFETEAQTLARLQHACVAQLYDAGRSAEGRLFFAMELVDGRPMTAYCDGADMAIRGRVDLFLRVCETIQHAHQRGVVHRDLKPSNVLIKEEGDSPVPKVIDFGIAKSLYEPNDGSITRDGLPLGTPGYMSPEQATGRPIDTRTDVFALGVMLYELLTGDLPFGRSRLSSVSPGEALRIVREEEPRRMSVAFRESDGAAAHAARRACEPPDLLRVLRSDLEWIVRKALAKDPEDRYASVSALIADLRCYQRSEPVSAREPAALYVTRRFVARHRLAVAVGGGVVALAAVGISALLWGLGEVSAARDVAVEREQEADRQRDRAVLGEYAARLAAARSALAIGSAEEARRHLLAAGPAHRGWEWRHLAERCDLSLSRIDVDDAVFDVAWLDAQRLLLRRQRFAEVYDVQTRALVRRLGPFEPELDEVIVWDGRLVVDARSRLELWDLGTWSRERVLYEPNDSTATDEWPANQGDVRAMKLALDGRTLLTSDNGGAVRAIDLQDRVSPRILCTLDTFCWAIEPLPDGLLALGTDHGRIEIIDAQSGERRHEPVELGREGVKALASSSEGDRLFAACGGALYALDVDGGSLRARRTSGAEITALHVSPDGSLVYACGASPRFTAWDATTLEIVSHFYGHEGDVLSASVHPVGERVASGSRDGTVRLWPARARPSCEMLDAGRDARDLDVAPDGSAIAVADADGRVRIWSAVDLVPEIDVRLGGPWRGCALGSEEVFVAGDELLALDRETGSARTGVAPPRRAGRLTIDAAEEWLLSVASGGGQVYLWSLPSLELEHVFDLPALDRAALDATSDTFLIAGSNGGIYRLDPRSPIPRRELETDGRVWSVALVGELLATAGTQLILSAPDTPALRFEGSDSTSAVAFLPDGERLATGGVDRLVRLWDRRGTELLVLDDAPKPVDELAFADEGRVLVGLSRLPGSPSYLVVWRAPTSVALTR